MIRLLTRSWKHVLIRGIFNAVFGVLVLAWPALSVSILVTLFAAFVLLVGFVTAVAAWRGREARSGWMIMFIQGLLGMAAALAAMLWPGITVAVLLILVASWAIATGVLEIVAAIVLRRQLEGEWMMVLSGVISVAFGVVLGLDPARGVVALAWVFGIFAVIRGITLMLLSQKLRGLQDWAEEQLAQGH